MIRIDIDNQIDCKFPKDLSSKIESFLDNKLSGLTKDIELSISFLRSENIRSLNHKFRNIDKPTDVLSFPIYPSIEAIKKSPAKIIELGDIVICPEISEKYIDDYHLSTGDDILTFLAIHGLNHLLGIHHK